MKKTLAASALTVGMLALPLAGSASADPTDTYPATYNGSGSDTTEVVMRALDALIPSMGSWDVTGGNWDTNDTGANCNFTGRVAGSGAGRTAVANSVANGDGCFQFARSSSRSTSSTPADLAIGAGDGTVGTNYHPANTTAVPMLPITLASDGLTYVYRAGSGTPRDLTLGQLRSIYHCVFTGTVDGRNMASSSIPNQPLLPTDASGSRSDWLKLMANAGDIAAYTGGGGEVASDPSGNLPACIEDGAGDTGIPGGEYSEHNGNVLTNGRQIILHGTGQWIAQGRSALGDFHGLAQLGYIGGNTVLQPYDNPGGALSPSTLSTDPVLDGAYFRPVYNIVPAANINDAGIQGIFGVRGGGTSSSGSDLPNADSGAICTSDGTLITYGFLPVC